MSKNLEKTYNPKEIEAKLYEKWCEEKYFHAEVDRSKKPFTTVMPPPNITGKLHSMKSLRISMLKPNTAFLQRCVPPQEVALLFRFRTGCTRKRAADESRLAET